MFRFCLSILIGDIETEEADSRESVTVVTKRPTESVQPVQLRAAWTKSDSTIRTSWPGGRCPLSGKQSHSWPLEYWRNRRQQRCACLQNVLRHWQRAASVISSSDGIAPEMQWTIGPQFDGSCLDDWPHFRWCNDSRVPRGLLPLTFHSCSK